MTYLPNGTNLGTTHLLGVPYQQIVDQRYRVRVLEVFDESSAGEEARARMQALRAAGFIPAFRGELSIIAAEYESPITCLNTVEMLEKTGFRPIIEERIFDVSTREPIWGTIGKAGLEMILRGNRKPACRLEAGTGRTIFRCPTSA
ncbi:MAG: hypothetical protein V1659_00070 [Candidatus Woesearchaeota archaeon]